MVALTTALGLAKFIPDIIDLFDNDDKETTSGKIISLAENVLGKKKDEILPHLENNPEAIVELRKAILNDKWVQDKLNLANTKSARDMHKINNQQADKIADKIIRNNIIFISILAGINGIALYFFKDNSELLLLIGNLVGFIIQALLKERQDVVNFYFGSSMGSKTKQLQLTEGKKQW